MSEDKMREQFYDEFPKFRGLLEQLDSGEIGYLGAINAVTHFNAWCSATKICSEIKNTELDDLKDMHCNELLEYRTEIAARDLMIKELREVLTFYANGRHFREGMECFGGGFEVKDFGTVAQQALANSEHHNSKVLEKMLLEAELKVLGAAYHICNPYGEEFRFMITERERKLAELNKE